MERFNRMLASILFFGMSAFGFTVFTATTWHDMPEVPGSNPGYGAEQFHDIANNPGQSGVSPQVQGNPSCNIHYGFIGHKEPCP